MNHTLTWSYVCAGRGDARLLRSDARSYLEAYADAGASDLDAAETIIGELVANVVRHGAPPFGICIDWHDDPPTLCISDRGPGLRRLYAVPGPDTESGRGLLLVRAFGGADVVLDPPSAEHGGTRVVVHLPVRRRAEAA